MSSCKRNLLQKTMKLNFSENHNVTVTYFEEPNVVLKGLVLNTFTLKYL